MKSHNPFDEKPTGIVWQVCLVAALSSLIYIFDSFDPIYSRAGWGPDDQLRLVQIRDFLNGQSWFDWTQYRMNVPDGAPMHWSRLIELPIMFLIVIFTPLFGQDIAEMIAGSLIPLLGITLTSYMLGRIALSLWNRQAAISAVILTWVNPSIVFQFRPMRIDHHGWQIMLATLALWSMFWPSKKRGGIILGIALATWLHISLEGLPITAAFFILLGWRWIIEKAHGQRLIWTIASFTVTTLILYIITQGLPFGATPYCDSMSPPYIAATSIAALIMLISINTTPDKRWIRLLSAIFAGMSALAILFYLAPQCSGGAFAQLDPLVHDYWYMNISEGLPIWRQKLHIILLSVTMVCIAIIALFNVIPKISYSSRGNLYTMGFFLIYAISISCFVFRTITVANAFALPLVAIILSEIFEAYRRSPHLIKRLGMICAMFFIAISGQLLSTLAYHMTSADGENKIQNSITNETPAINCKSVQGIEALNRLPVPSHIMAPFNLGPLILLNSKHNIVASSHHRNEGAMRDQIATMIGSPDDAITILKKRNIEYIVACSASVEWSNYQRKHQGSLADLLLQEKPPNWLKPISGNGELMIWRVDLPSS